MFSSSLEGFPKFEQERGLQSFIDTKSHNETLDDDLSQLNPTLTHRPSSPLQPNSNEATLFEHDNLSNAYPYFENELEGNLDAVHTTSNTASSLIHPSFASHPSNSNFGDVKKNLSPDCILGVGLYHKTRGGRNTFGAISADAMVRVTKGVGKRLQLRVEFSVAQQIEMRKTCSSSNTIPFVWDRFQVKLEELSNESGAVISEKPCELDMLELFVVSDANNSSAQTDDNANGSGVSYVSVTENAPYTIEKPLIAQCELKLFHLSKTLRFRVEYTLPSPSNSFVGHSLMFFTHDSGKSKKVAFGPQQTPQAIPAAAKPIEDVAKRELSNSQSKLQKDPNYSPAVVPVKSHMDEYRSLVVDDPWQPQQGHANDTKYLPPHPSYLSTPSPSSATRSPSYSDYEDHSMSSPSSQYPQSFQLTSNPAEQQQHSMDQHNLNSQFGFGGPSFADPWTHHSVAPLFTHSTFMSDVDDITNGAHPSNNYHVRPQNSVQYTQQPSQSRVNNMMDADALEASSGSSCSSSSGINAGSQIYSESSESYMDMESYGKEASEEQLESLLRGEMPENRATYTGGASSFSSSSSSQFSSRVPANNNGSVSSSLSSDDGTPAMSKIPRVSKHSHRSKSGRSNSISSSSSSTVTTPRRSNNTLSSSSSTLLDGLDDQSIENQLSGRGSNKRKRKTDQMTTIPVSAEYPFVCPGSLDVQGVVRAQSFVQFSDIRFKTNVEDITDALNIVTQLHGKKYEWKDSIAGSSPASNLSGGKKVIGLIAQEVKRVIPEVVVTDNNGYLSLNYTDMVPLLIEALKQHVSNSVADSSMIKEEISELRAKVDELSASLGDSSCTDTSSFLDFSEDESLDGSFQDEDWDMSDIQFQSRSAARNSGNHTARRDANKESSANHETSSAKSSKSTKENGDMEILSKPESNSTKSNKQRSSDDKTSHNGSYAITPKRLPRTNSALSNLSTIPFLTLITCMTHKKMSPTNQPNSVKQADLEKALQSTTLNPSSSVASSSPTSVQSKEKDKEREKDREAGQSMKRTATQRMSKSFINLLHHIQTSTSNIVNSAVSLTKGSSQSTEQAQPAAADDSPREAADTPSSPRHASSSSQSASANSAQPSSSSSSSSLPSSAKSSQQPSTQNLLSLNSGVNALSLAASTSEVRAQILSPGFNRVAPNQPIKRSRQVHRAVVITISAWHLWSTSDQEKMFLDESEARNSLVMTGKAVSQIESSFPECDIIHTLSVDMRGTIQATTDDILMDIQRRQVPSQNSSQTSTSGTTSTYGTSTSKNSSTPSKHASSGSSKFSNSPNSFQSQLEQADLVWFIGHSQGVQSCVFVCERLLRNGVLSASEQMVSILSLGGLHHHCAHSLMSLHANPMIHAGLPNFGNHRKPFKEYKMALSKLMEMGVTITTIGAYQDALINISSSSLDYMKHPNIVRALLVHHEFKSQFDPRHAFKKASNFTQEMTRFAFEMKNKARPIELLPFLNNHDSTGSDVQETASWISHAKTFPRDKLHQLLYNPHIEFPATVPGFYYALGATMSMFNTRAFRFHKSTRQLREGIQRHREIPFVQDCYRLGLEWLCSKSQVTSSATSSIPIAITTKETPAIKEEANLKIKEKSSKSSKNNIEQIQQNQPIQPDLQANTLNSFSSDSGLVFGLAPIFREGSNGFAYDFAEQMQAVASCSRAETARLQSAFRYWKPEGPKEIIMQKLVTKTLGWSVCESSLAQYVDGFSEKVNPGNEKEENHKSANLSPSTSPSSSSVLHQSSSNSGTAPQNTPSSPKSTRHKDNLD